MSLLELLTQYISKYNSYSVIGLAYMTVVLFYDYNKSMYNSNFVISIITLYTSFSCRNKRVLHGSNRHCTVSKCDISVCTSGERRAAEGTQE